MAAIDELISTYLTACEVEGEVREHGDRVPIDAPRVGIRLGLPGGVQSYVVQDVYAYLAELREPGARLPTSIGASVR